MKETNTPGLYYNHQTKFSTITFEIVFATALEYANIEGRNLVAKSIIEGTKQFPSKLAMRRHLADLYAAYVASGVSKDGLSHEVSFQFSFVHPDSVEDTSYTMATIFDTILEIIKHPAMENNNLKGDIVSLEKRLMVDRINRMYDDKTRYSQMRMTEIMFAGTPIAIKAYGEIAKYESISIQEVTESYYEMLQKDAISMYVVGDVPKDTVIHSLYEHLDNGISHKLLQEKVTLDTKNEVTEVVELQEVQQSKVFIGYQLDGDLSLHKYIANQVAASILGGGLHSKLFMNVREKASLAYTVSAGIDTRALVLFIYAGIDFDKKDEALAIIDAQVDAILHAEISEEELFMSKETLIHAIESSRDNPFAIINIQKNIVRIGDGITQGQWIDAIESVSVEDVVRVAKQWKKNTVYILGPNGKAGVGHEQ